jgi:hypothetical protein
MYNFDLTKRFLKIVGRTIVFLIVCLLDWTRTKKPEDESIIMYSSILKL